MTTADPERVSDLWLQPGDVLIERSNTPELVGTARLYTGPPDYAIFPDLVIRARLCQQIDPRFLELYLHTPEARRYFQLAAQGIAGSMPKISQPTIENLSVLVAPLPEQHRIVEAIESYFSRLDEAVATLERVQRNLERYRASVLKAAVEGRLVPTEAELARAEGRDYEPASVLLERILVERRRRWEQAELAKMKAKGKTPKNDRWKAKYQEPAAPDTSDLPELPEGWCWTSFDAVLREPLRNGKSARASKDGSGVRTLTLTAVTDGDFSEKNTKLTVATASEVEDLWLKPEDILIERANTPELVGTAAMYRGSSGFAIFPDLMIRARVTSTVSAAYAEAILHSPLVRRYFQRASQGIAGSMPKISQGTVESLALPLPPFAEQIRIVEELERHLSVRLSTEASARGSIHRAQRLRQSILKWAFEGKLADQDPDDEPASVLLERIRAEREAAPGAPRRRRGRPRKPGRQKELFSE